MLLKFFHFAVVALNSFTLYYDQYHTDIPYPQEIVDRYPLKGRTVYLTYWCFVINTVYFALALLNDFIGTNAAAPRKTPITRKLKDVIFSLAFTVAVFISTVFWGIYLIRKELAVDIEIEHALPLWLNHVLHTFTSVNLGLEMLLSNITYPKRKLGLTILIVFKTISAQRLVRVYFNTGVWIYPIFRILNWPQVIAFLLFNIAYAVVLYILCEKLHRAVYSSTKGKAKGN